MPHATTNETHQSVSQVVREISALMKREGDVTIGQCVELLGERSILIVLLLFSLLNSLPLPSIPGFSTITGAPIILLGFQLLLGFEKVWLPSKVENYTLKATNFEPRFKRLEKHLQKAEHYIRPRFFALSTPALTRLTGILFILMATLLALPIPFLNFPAGFTMSLLAIGMIEEDGLLIGIAASLMMAVLLTPVVLLL